MILCRPGDSRSSASWGAFGAPPTIMACSVPGAARCAGRLGSASRVRVGPSIRTPSCRSVRTTRSATERRVEGGIAMIRTLRISHPAFFGTKLEETIRFYTELLGMEIVLRQPNLDDASMEHLFFHVGEDNFIAYFLTTNDQEGRRYAPAKPGIGGMNHLAIDVDEASFEEARARLRAEGVDVRGPTDRGYERSIYFKDPNGVRIELLVWLT